MLREVKISSVYTEAHPIKEENELKNKILKKYIENKEV